MATSEVKQHWEDRYAERDRIWSGRVNAHLERVAAPLPPGGRALDLGCGGEGGDSLWLAEHGWKVLGVDISDTALGRAAAEAEARGLTDRVSFVQTDLSQTFPEGGASTWSPRSSCSRWSISTGNGSSPPPRAPSHPVGVLIVVDHGEAPPWAQHVRDHVFPTAEEVFATIDLGDRQWDRVHLGSVERDAVGPDGQAGVLVDNLIVLRRVVSTPPAV